MLRHHAIFMINYFFVYMVKFNSNISSKKISFTWFPSITLVQSILASLSNVLWFESDLKFTWRYSLRRPRNILRETLLGSCVSKKSKKLQRPAVRGLSASAHTLAGIITAPVKDRRHRVDIGVVSCNYHGYGVLKLSVRANPLPCQRLKLYLRLRDVYTVVIKPTDGQKPYTVCEKN